MSEYDSIVKRLREWPHASSEYKGSVDELHDQAADAIEELKEQIDKNNNWWAMAKTLMDMVMSLPKWISVAEQLPEKPGQYIIYLQSPEYVREQWNDYGFEDDGSYATVAFYDDQQKIWQMENDAYNTNLCVVDMKNDYAVTHWMPLPTRPENTVDPNNMDWKMRNCCCELPREEKE